MYIHNVHVHVPVAAFWVALIKDEIYVMSREFVHVI